MLYHKNIEQAFDSDTDDNDSKQIIYKHLTIYI